MDVLAILGALFMKSLIAAMVSRLEAFSLVAAFAFRILVMLYDGQVMKQFGFAWKKTKVERN